VIEGHQGLGGLGDNSRSDLLDEFICALDPVEFAASLGITCDPWQANALRSPHRRIQIVAARQSGKSFCCAIYALWFAIHHPNVTVLIISPALRQSQLMFRSIIDFYTEMPHKISSDIETALTLRMTNHSMIVALPGASERTIRGYKADCIIFDESALIDDDTYRAVRPMAAISDAKIFAIGSPHGKRGWFYESWAHSDEFYKIKVTASTCPRLASRPEYLAQERRILGQFWYEQEFECVFHQAEDSIFRLELIEASIGDFPELHLGLDEENDIDDDMPMIDSSHELHLEHLDDLSVQKE
jgi:hypothetical protein